MMIQPINVYDAKRKVKPRSGHDGPREANGRTSRAKVPDCFMVYFVRVEGSAFLKVGRTRNIATRIQAYEHNSGRSARCHAQLVTASRADCVVLENHVIEYLAARFKRSRREWFIVPPEDLASVVKEIQDSSPVAIKAMNGRPGAPDALPSNLAEQGGREARAHAASYFSRRGRVKLIR